MKKKECNVNNNVTKMFPKVKGAGLKDTWDITSANLPI